MCRAKKEENNGAAPLRSVSGEVFATFASLLLVALVLMCMLQTGLSCAYFAQERKSALTAVLDGATAMAETYASEGNIVTLPGGDNELVERAKTGFELFNTSSDALTLEQMARDLGYNYTYLSAYFNHSLHTGFQDFINQYRISHAAALLQGSSLPITQVAEQCGFGTIRSFNRVFLKEKGMTPSAFRKQNVL